MKNKFLLRQLASFAFLCVLAAHLHGADAAPATPADQAWEQVRKAVRPPAPPAEWGNKPPTQEQREEYRKLMADKAAEAAGKAKAFHEAHPDHKQAAEAKRLEKKMLETAARYGNQAAAALIEKEEQAALEDPNAPEAQRYEHRARAALRAASAKRPEGRAAYYAELEKQARQLIEEFPKRDEPRAMLLDSLSDAPEATVRTAVKAIEESTASDRIKDRARGMVKKLDLLGHPLAMRFTAVDGRQIDLAKLKGKVLLIDFWATWCGPCVAELPNVKAAYVKLHPKGFEIIGISFDNDKQALTGFVEKEKVAWPQYFDGKGWGNAFGKEYGISSIPTMWLIDRKGNLRDLDARAALEEKVTQLLAESQ